MLKTGVPHQTSKLMMLVWILLTLHSQWLTSAENASPTKVTFSRDNVSTFFVPPLEPKFRYNKHNLEGMIKLVSQKFGTILTHNVPALPKLSSYENITNNVVVVPLVVAEHNKRSKIEEQMRVKVSFDMSPSTTYKFRARNIPYNRSFSVAKHYADEANKIHPGTVDTLVLHHEDYLHFVMRDYQGDTEITKKLEFIKDVLNNTENTKYKLGVMISRAFFEDTNKTPLTELLKYVDEVYPTIYARQDLDAEPEAVPDHTLQLQSFKSCNQTIKGINPDVKIIPILMCSPSKSTTGVVTTSDFFQCWQSMSDWGLEEGHEVIMYEAFDRFQKHVVMEMGLWRLKNDADQNVTEESFEEKTNLDIYHRPIKTDGLTAIFFDHQVRVHLTPRLSSYSEQDVIALLQVISTRFPTVITAPNSYFGTKEFSSEAMEWVPKVAAKLNKNNMDKKDSIEKPISILFSFYQLESPEIPRNSSNSTPVLDLKVALEVAESANEIFPGTVTTLLFDGFRKVDKIEQLNQLKTGLNSEPAKRAIQKGIKIGTIIDLRTCQKFNSSVFAPITEKVDLFIIDVKDSKAVARHPISILRKRIFDAGICMRFLKGLAPDVKVMVSVNCKEIATVNSVAALEDRSACVHMVSEWGKDNKVGVVMPQAFDVPSAPDGSNSFPDKEGGWWKMEKKTEQDLHANLFVETFDEFLREQIDSDSSFGVGTVFLAICIVVAIALLLLATAGVLTIWVRRKQALLSGLEMDEFFNGVKVKAAASSLELKDVDDNIFMRLKYSRKKFEIKKREFHFDDSTNTILGQGNYGVVHKLKLSKFPNHVAVKIPNSDCTKETLKSLLSEIKIMSYVGVNEYVVQFLGAYTKEIQRGIVYIVTELCEKGSLLSHLVEMKKTFEENKSGGIIELTRFCREIAAGMNFITEKGVIHGDLSARNVLLDSNETCKICDFGLSKKLYQYKIYASQQHDMERPWRWLAIESLKRFVFSVKSDVWAYGVTVWEIFSFGDVPYPGILHWDSDFAKVLEGGLRMKKPKIAPAKIYSTMVDCWNIDPEFRPTFEKLVELFEVTVADYENV